MKMTSDQAKVQWKQDVKLVSINRPESIPSDSPEYDKLVALTIKGQLPHAAKVEKIHPIMGMEDTYQVSYRYPFVELNPIDNVLSDLKKETEKHFSRFPFEPPNHDEGHGYKTWDKMTTPVASIGPNKNERVYTKDTLLTGIAQSKGIRVDPLTGEMEFNPSLRGTYNVKKAPTVDQMQEAELHHIMEALIQKLGVDDIYLDEETLSELSSTVLSTVGKIKKEQLEEADDNDEELVELKEWEVSMMDMIRTLRSVPGVTDIQTIFNDYPDSISIVLRTTGDGYSDDELDEAPERIDEIIAEFYPKGLAQLEVIYNHKVIYDAH